MNFFATCVYFHYIILYNMHNQYTDSPIILAGGEDFVPIWTELTFNSMVARQSVSISIIDDRIQEGEEHFNVMVTSVDPRCVPGRPATVTIAMSGEVPNIAL